MNEEECKPKIIRQYKDFECDEEYTLVDEVNCEICDNRLCKHWIDWHEMEEK